MAEYICKGCGEPIIAGQLRYGDNWHEACRSAAWTERRRSAKLKRHKGLTETQDIILQAALNSPTGSIVFGRGDRKGTRVIGYDDMGRPWIKAYADPQYFLKVRGLLEPANEPHVYRITAAGRAMVDT